jgi:hypothetical protein
MLPRVVPNKSAISCPERRPTCIANIIEPTLFLQAPLDRASPSAHAGRPAQRVGGLGLRRNAGTYGPLESARRLISSLSRVYRFTAISKGFSPVSRTSW